MTPDKVVDIATCIQMHMDFTQSGLPVEAKERPVGEILLFQDG